MPDPSILTLDQYMELPRPEIKWLIPGLLPKPGLVVLLGAPFSGKSFLALQLSLALAQGQSLLGREPSKPAKVFYLQLDTSELIWRDRLSSLKKAGVNLEGPIYMPHPEHLASPVIVTDASSRSALKAVLNDIQPDIVIVDVLRELHQFDENDSTAMKVVGDSIQTVFGPYCTILLHHSKKLWGEIDEVDPIMACRGSSYIPGKADALWLLGGGKLKLTSRYHETEIIPLKRVPSGFWSVGKAAKPIDPSQKFALSVHQMATQLNPEASPEEVYEAHQAELEKRGISLPMYHEALQAAGVL